MDTAALARITMLGVTPEALPPLAPCAHCAGIDAIEILYSISAGTWSISCMSDGWTTADHTDLRAAISEWNTEQAHIHTRARQRAGMSLH